MDEQTGISQVPSNQRELRTLRFVMQVEPQAFTDQEINWLWEKVKDQDYAFDDISRDNAAYFCMVLLAPQSAHFFIKNGEDVVGWCLIRNLYERSNPDIHFCVWDKSFTAHQAKQAGREVLDWVFRVWNVNRITAMVAEYNEAAKRLATLLRFQFEGCMKEAVLFHGRWRHVNMYGLLREEFYKVIN